MDASVQIRLPPNESSTKFAESGAATPLKKRLIRSQKTFAGWRRACTRSQMLPNVRLCSRISKGRGTTGDACQPIGISARTVQRWTRHPRPTTPRCRYRHSGRPLRALRARSAADTGRCQAGYETGPRDDRRPQSRSSTDEASGGLLRKSDNYLDTHRRNGLSPVCPERTCRKWLLGLDSNQQPSG